MSVLARFVLFLLAAAVAAAETWTGKVVGITDGDTIVVLRGTTQVKIRLDAVDAPESSQAFGTRARMRAADLAFGRTVTVRAKPKDRYGRTVAEIILPDGRSMNQEMVRSGYAWWYRKYAPRSLTLARLEEEAREARRGLWADSAPEPPWLWRKARRVH